MEACKINCFYIQKARKTRKETSLIPNNSLIITAVTGGQKVEEDDDDEDTEGMKQEKLK